MKARFVCAVLALLISVVACSSQPISSSHLRGYARTPVPAGHYSLYDIPVVVHKKAKIVVSSENKTPVYFFKADDDRLSSVFPRFGRSLRYDRGNQSH